MAGHSKWAKVKHFKGAIDAKRAKIFAKLSREITIAVTLGQSGDPAMNPRLRMVLLKCRSANMPSDNVQRAIKKALGDGDAAAFQELTYEVYGPNAVAVLVEVNTDNRNRSAADIRHILSKYGGNLATSGSVTRLFDRKGQIIVGRDDANEDELMEIALEAGAEDFKAEEECFEIITDPSEFEAVHKAIDDKGINCSVSEVTSIPNLTVPIAEDEAGTLNRLIEALEDNDDVSNVYSNADIQG